MSQNAKPEAEIITAENYKKALLEAKDQKIDVAILDIEMPGITKMTLSNAEPFR